MGHEDLPGDWAMRSLAEPMLAQDVLDLCVSDRDRRMGGLSVLLCRCDGRLSQPIFIGDRHTAPDLRHALGAVAESSQHMAGVGAAVVAIVRSTGADPWVDQLFAQVAEPVCRAASLPLLGTYLVSANRVRPLAGAAGDAVA